MANLDEFNLQLSGELDQQQSKKNINDDIATLERAIEHLKVQAEIDPNSVKNIAKQLSDILNQKIVVDNIQIDTAKATKTAQQLGQKIGDAVEKSVQQSLSIDDIIDKQVTDLMSKYSIAGKKGSKAFDEIRQAVVNYRKELSTVSDFDPDDEFSFFSNSADISKVSSALANHIKVVDDTKGAYQGLAEYIKAVNNSGAKIHLPESIRQEYGDDFSSMRSQLGKAFTTGKGGDFESFVTELNGQLGNVIDLSQGAEAAFGDLVQKVNSAKGGNFLSGNELFNQGFLDRNEIEKNITSAINIIDEEEKKLAQTSTSTSNTVVQNEQKKQQAYQQTAKVQKALTSEESVIKSGVGVRTFDDVKEAQDYFTKLLENEQAVIATTERFGQNNNLTSFTVNIKRATGEVESLRYAVDALKDDEGNIEQIFYKLSGSTTGDSGAIKQIKDIENAFSDYTAKLSQFKSTNSEILSGLTTPLSDFETKLTGLKIGTSTIDEVANAYKSLNAEASNITKNFSRQLSPIDSAIRNLAKGEETISSLRAEFKGLNNAPKEINTELNKCARLLENVKKIESQEGRTENWSQAYRQWSDSVDTLQAKLKTLRKEQSNVASTQIFNTSDLKNNNIAYMSKVYNTIEKQMVEINRLAKAKDWQIVDVSGVEQADGKIKKLTLTVRDAEGALKKLDMQREKLQGNGKAQYGLMQVGDVKVLETASQAQEKLTQSTEKANAKLSEQANKIQLSMGVNGDTTSKIEVLRNNFAKLGLSADEVKTKMSGVDTEVKTLQSLMNSGSDNSAIVTQFEKLQTVLTQTQNNLKQTRSDYSLLATEQQRLSLANTIEAWNQKNTRATKEVRAENDRYVASLRDLNTQMTKLQFGQIQTGFKQTENSMRTLNRLGASLKDQMKQAAESFSQWISVSSAIMGVVYSTKQAVSELKEVDNILTEISKTSDMTSQELEKLGMSSYSSASKYGRTATDYLTGVQEMSRSGFYGDKGTAMAEQSLLAQSAGDMTSELANSYILATNAAYKFNGEASKINEVLDGQNSITNKNSVAMADMATAMTKAGTVASSYNVSIEDLSAMIGTMESVTKLGGEEVGTGIKSLLINLQNISSSKITGTLDKANASMTEMKNGIEQLRNPIVILRDLAKTFNDLDEKDPLRAEILTNIGGKYQADCCLYV